MIASMLNLSRKDCKDWQLKDGYSMHRIVYSLFPKQENETREFLFADKGIAGQCHRILILSKRLPEKPDFGEITSKEISESILSHDHYGFEITLNPATRNGQSRKLIPVRGKDNLCEWFIKKSLTTGFEIDPNSLCVGQTQVQQFDKIKEGTKFLHTHGSATFTGKLKVTSRELFKKSFEQGIGRARGFGFGLLQIVPMKSN
ncbi:type I-E CRISPR-associated protein Cas6/Cse3/CasE [bacterium]|nr:type I-E CRISPR-associated protein Cas6/Cse3/CasE [bacterium]